MDNKLQLKLHGLCGSSSENSWNTLCSKSKHFQVLYFDCISLYENTEAVDKLPKRN